MKNTFLNYICSVIFTHTFYPCIQRSKVNSKRLGNILGGDWCLLIDENLGYTLFYIYQKSLLAFIFSLLILARKRWFIVYQNLNRCMNIDILSGYLSYGIALRGHIFHPWMCLIWLYRYTRLVLFPRLPCIVCCVKRSETLWLHPFVGVLSHLIIIIVIVIVIIIIFLLLLLFLIIIIIIIIIITIIVIVVIVIIIIMIIIITIIITITIMLLL